jgi:hypothetical protein
MVKIVRAGKLNDSSSVNEDNGSPAVGTGSVKTDA